MKAKFAQSAICLSLGMWLVSCAAFGPNKSEAKINQEEAAKTALSKVPDGKIKSTELEKEHGKLVWSFDIATPESKNITEIQVDANTGEIVSNEVETAEDEAKEAVADKK